jgi:hypothetical protein
VYSNDHEPPHFHLFSPPEREFGRGYSWPDLKPINPRSPSLTIKLKKALQSYFEQYGEAIRVELQQVYQRPLASFGAA